MGLFSSKTRESVALIDINSTSVGSAYAHFTSGAVPAIYYTARVPINPHDGESLTQAMLRALSVLGNKMIEEGAPALHREVGSGHVDRVLASVGSPWQETRVHVETMWKDVAFTFTRAQFEEAAAKARTHAEDRTDSGTTVIATLLNGYETAHPFGKRTKRANVIILSSTLEKEAAKGVHDALRHLYHAHTIELTGFAPASYAVFRDLYPHQKDFLVLDVSGSTTDAAFIKHGLLTGVESVHCGTRDLMVPWKMSGVSEGPASEILNTSRNAAFTAQVNQTEGEWIGKLRAVFGEFAKGHALPRTLFLIAEESSRDFLKRLLDTKELRALWLSDEPLSIIPALPEQFAPYVQTRGVAEADLYLTMLALFHAKRVAGLTRTR